MCIPLVMAKKQGELSAVDVGRREPGVEDFLTARQARGATDRTLRNYAAQLGMVRRRSPKPLLDLTVKEATAVAAKLAREAQGYTVAITIRMYYNHHTMPDVAKAFRLRKKKSRIDPSTILTVDDVNKILLVATNKRDVALVAVLYDSGARIHEVLALELQHLTRLESKENGGRVFYKVFFPKVKVQGQERQVLLAESAPYIDAWLKSYPLPRRKEAPVFPSAQHSSLGHPLSVDGARTIVKTLAAKAGVGKPANPHAWRHARTSALLMVMHEGPLKRRHGWVASSRMLEVYSHLRDADVDDEYLRSMGLAPRVPEDVGHLAPVNLEGLPALPVVVDLPPTMPDEALREQVRAELRGEVRAALEDVQARIAGLDPATLQALRQLATVVAKARADGLEELHLDVRIRDDGKS